MLSPETVYPLLLAWVQALAVAPQPAAATALAQRLTALLLGQSLAPASLMRALVSAPGVPARQRYRRVARTWSCRWLTAAWLTPLLLRAVLALLRPPGQVYVVLDSVRCGRWEIFTLGVVWHRRVLLVGWALLPYPWPTGRFTPLVCALLQQLDAAWPADQPKPHLLADRGFPSHTFFATLRRLGWDFTVRLRTKLTVTRAGQRLSLRQLQQEALPERWTEWWVQYGGKGPLTRLVLGQGLSVRPWHQRDAGSTRARQYRAARRVHDLRDKHPRRQQPSTAPETDRWVQLLTTASSRWAAVRAYSLRYATEGTYRDGQSGWDGRHGWDLEPTVAAQADAAVVERIIGLWTLGLLAQSWVGDQIGQPTAPAAVQQVVASWTTTGRLSLWARGRLAFQDWSGQLANWLPQTLQAGADRIAAAPPAIRTPLPQAA
jgi:hypothetical protein